MDIQSMASRVAARYLAAGSFELVYSTGGHGGPYKSEAEAKARAEKLLAGGRDAWVAVIPSEQVTDLKKAKVAWLLKREGDSKVGVWTQGPQPLPNVAPHSHYFAAQKVAADLCVVCGKPGEVIRYTAKGMDKTPLNGRVFVKGTVLCEKHQEMLEGV